MDAIVDAHSCNYHGRELAIFRNPGLPYHIVKRPSHLTLFTSEMGMIPTVSVHWSQEQRFTEDIETISKGCSQ